MSRTVIDYQDTATVQQEVRALRDWQHEDLSVAVVCGPVSAEDKLYLAKSPVDQLSVTALTHTLGQIGTRARVLNPCDPGFVADLPGFDVVLSNLHGVFGEDGRLQGLLDYLRRPYTGSGVEASAIAANKITCKRMMSSLGIPTPAYQVWPDHEIEWRDHPVMVKPAMGGSSVGMSLVAAESDLPRALAEAVGTDPSPVLVEQYVPGLPVTVGMLELPGGLLAFPPLATEVPGDFYDAETKLDADAEHTVSVVPANLPIPVLQALTFYALRLWEGLGCRDWARVDFIVATTGELYGLEVNTTPGLSQGSNFMVGAGLCGLSHADVVLAALHSAVKRPIYDVPLPAPALTTS